MDLQKVQLTKIIFLCIAGFIASFVDSIAGGGGLISLPAFLMAGIPPYFSLGTNKFAATAASFTSSIKYVKSGKTNKEILKYLLPCTFIGAVIGVKTVLKIDQQILYILVLIMVLFVGVYSMFSKTIGAEDNYTGADKKKIAEGMILALSIGFYDGFFGPGTGSFLIFGLIGIYGFNFLAAGGNARMLNFASNITALLLFAVSGRIDYYYGIPVAVCMIFGAQYGTKFALKHGSKYIKYIFVTMSLALAAKMLWSIFK